MGKLSEIVRVVKCVFAVHAHVLILHNHVSGVDRQLVLVCVLHLSNRPRDYQIARPVLECEQTSRTAITVGTPKKAFFFHISRRKLSKYPTDLEGKNSKSFQKVDTKPPVLGKCHGQAHFLCSTCTFSDCVLVQSTDTHLHFVSRRLDQRHKGSFKETFYSSVQAPQKRAE
jgi:hypothetical protein